METLREVFSTNLGRLRNERGWTQAELGKQLNYSDKTISKWERGESMPDIAALKELAGAFGVTLDDLVSDPNQEKPNYAVASAEEIKELQHKERARKSKQYRNVERVTQAGITGTAVFVVILLWMIFKTIYWQIFVYMAPLCFLVEIIFRAIWGQHKVVDQFVFISLFCCSVLSCFYVGFLSHRFWQLYLLMIPVEMILFCSLNIYRTSKAQSPEVKAEKQRNQQEKKQKKEAAKTK